jgi:hypothetical protein
MEGWENGSKVADGLKRFSPNVLPHAHLDLENWLLTLIKI